MAGALATGKVREDAEDRIDGDVVARRACGGAGYRRCGGGVQDLPGTGEESLSIPSLHLCPAPVLRPQGHSGSGPQWVQWLLRASCPQKAQGMTLTMLPVLGPLPAASRRHRSLPARG